MILSNNRYKWHKNYVQASGGRYEDCPDDAFAALLQFQESMEGKAKSEAMKGIRSKVGKYVSFCSDANVKATPPQSWRSQSSTDHFSTLDHKPPKVSLEHSTITLPCAGLFFLTQILTVIFTFYRSL